MRTSAGKEGTALYFPFQAFLTILTLCAERVRCHHRMTERPKLVLSPWIKGERFSYRCSICDQPFLLPEDRSPKEAMEEVLAAFNEHVCDEHQMEPV
jgi:hypothetical protein